jgi:hypothetical protein
MHYLNCLYVYIRSLLVCLHLVIYSSRSCAGVSSWVPSTGHGTSIYWSQRLQLGGPMLGLSWRQSLKHLPYLTPRRLPAAVLVRQTRDCQLLGAGEPNGDGGMGITIFFFELFCTSLLPQIQNNTHTRLKGICTKVYLGCSFTVATTALCGVYC